GRRAAGASAEPGSPAVPARTPACFRQSPAPVRWVGTSWVASPLPSGGTLSETAPQRQASSAPGREGDPLIRRSGGLGGRGRSGRLEAGAVVVGSRGAQRRSAGATSVGHGLEALLGAQVGLPRRRSPRAAATPGRRQDGTGADTGSAGIRHLAGRPGHFN